MANRSPTPFGMLLKRYRTAAMLTQEQLAIRARLSPDTIRALESGKRRTPRPDSLHQLVAALALTDAEREALLATALPPTGALSTGDPITLPPGVALWAVQPGSLIGRKSELETIRQRLASHGEHAVERARLLTLTGPAGVGKTRLALAAATLMADQFPDGVVLVDLTPVRDPVLVLPTIARAVGLDDIGGRPLSERLREYLRERSTLLLLDNFEQVLPAAGILADALASCPGLTLVVTSRIPLRLRWEWTLRVAPLQVPDLNLALPPMDTLVGIPAVGLFIARARTRQADFVMNESEAALVARITAEVDGLPLAIELAAARLDGLSLSTIASRLGDRLRLLRWEAPDIPERQHSLAAAVGWSYDLLSVSEQRLFRCLGVFVGQVSLPAITAVVAAVAQNKDTANDDGWASARNKLDEGPVLERLASLAEKSLVMPIGRQRLDHEPLKQEGNPERGELDAAFRMLETVREYAWEQLTAMGELETAQRAHSRYFLALAERASSQLRGPHQVSWLLRLEHEHDNLRVALRWCLDAGTRDDHSPSADHEDALRLASALAYFWWSRGYIVEGWHWLEETLRRVPEGNPVARTRALLGAGAMLSYQGAFDRASVVLKEALALAHELDLPDEIAQAYAYLGLRAVYAGDAEASAPLLREALRRGRSLEDHHLVGLTLMFFGGAALAQDHTDDAASLYAESLECFEMAGDGRFAGNLHVHFGWLAAQRGDLREAVRHIRAGLDAGVAFEERRLLGAAAQAALALPGRPNVPSDLDRRMRLMGAVDAISQATGMTLLQTLVKASLADLREHLKDSMSEAAYREGRSLPFDAVATLLLALLDDASSMRHQAESAPDAIREPRDTYEMSQVDGRLSPRQRDVLRLVAQGLTNKDIAQRLSLSTSTVSYHLNSAFNKLGVSTRARAIAIAAQRGLF